MGLGISSTLTGITLDDLALYYDGSETYPDGSVYVQFPTTNDKYAISGPTTVPIANGGNTQPIPVNSANVEEFIRRSLSQAVQIPAMWWGATQARCKTALSQAVLKAITIAAV